MIKYRKLFITIILVSQFTLFYGCDSSKDSKRKYLKYADEYLKIPKIELEKRIEKLDNEILDIIKPSAAKPQPKFLNTYLFHTETRRTRR